MKKKKLLSALLAGVMAVTLTACGSNSASTEGSAASGSVSTASGSTSTASGSTSSEEAKPVDGGQIIIGDQTQSTVIFIRIGQIMYQITVCIGLHQAMTQLLLIRMVSL